MAKGSKGSKCCLSPKQNWPKTNPARVATATVNVNPNGKASMGSKKG